MAKRGRPPKPDEVANPNSDEILARALLNGAIERLSKKWRKQYKHDACAALARLLRSPKPLPYGLREQLAEWFDHFHQKGRRRDHFRNTEIADYIWKRIGQGGKVEPVIEDAKTKFGLKRSQIMNIWTPYKRIFEDLSIWLGERW